LSYTVFDLLIISINFQYYHFIAKETFRTRICMYAHIPFYWK